MRVSVTSLLLAGCFSPQGEPLAFETLPFENDYTSAPDIVLRPFEFDDLLCPDGEPSVFYAVYREQYPDPMPIAIFFHSGAFDYVTTPDAANPLSGGGYQVERRFSAEWAGNKVFETFGLLPGAQIDPNEINAGTLPAALADAGVFTLYPANCWGDLWHNEDYYSPNEWDSDGSIHRQGRFLAWYMSRIASTDADVTAEWRTRYGLDDLQVSLDASGIYTVGLGEGGRGAAELLRRVRDTGDTAMPPVKGIIMDSTMDKLYYLHAQKATFPEYDIGLTRIFPDDTDGLGTDDLGQYSMQRWIAERNTTWNTPLEVVWSSADPQVPDETLTDLLALPTTYPNLADYITVTDVGTTGHVFLNNDEQAARRAVDRMLGNIP